MAACDTWLLKLGSMNPAQTYKQYLTHLDEDSSKNALILKIVYGSVVPYYTSLWLYTIVPVSLSTYRKALHVVAFVMLTSMVVVLCVNLFWCTPIPRNWSLDREKICSSPSMVPVFVISTACNVVTDIVIMILPLPLLQNVKFQYRSQLVGTVCIFALGCLALLSSLVRVATLAGTAILTHVAVWSSVEVAVGIAIASLPSVRTLLYKNGRSVRMSLPSRARDQGETGQTYTNGSRPGGGPKDWLSVEEGEVDTLRSNNRDTIKSHSTVITIPTAEELEGIRCGDFEGATVRSIVDLQRFHDSMLSGRHAGDTTPSGHEWTFDKAQWRYTEPEPSGPINMDRLGAVPDVVLVDADGTC
ncbi:hypothetical protein DRE_07347 [Drechslerella stenobrocha 248]|uniref:Rhodopsin domain-containing protein n=1 Tax=Drechslerella stenobrocha 248 TaxID=1043628 RepID=W7HUR6_9PEZI|nr:hypothetical protein DRE_07347 [Drechslerella stenobrocha 248]